jgi:hypothetical protein
MAFRRTRSTPSWRTSALATGPTLTRYASEMEGLLDERPRRLSGLLYPSPRGRPWSVRNFYRDVWEPAREKSGTSFTLYDLRHTFSSRLLAAGIPLVEVAAWMRHSLRAGGAHVDNTTSRVHAHATGEWGEVALAELTALVTGEWKQRRRPGGQGPGADRCLGLRSIKTWRKRGSRSIYRSGKPRSAGLSRRRSRVRVPSLASQQSQIWARSLRSPPPVGRLWAACGPRRSRLQAPRRLRTPLECCPPMQGENGGRAPVDHAGGQPVPASR